MTIRKGGEELLLTGFLWGFGSKGRFLRRRPDYQSLFYHLGNTRFNAFPGLPHLFGLGFDDLPFLLDNRANALRCIAQSLTYEYDQLTHRSNPHSLPSRERPDRSRMGGRRGSSSKSGPCNVPARRKTHFKPGKDLKKAMCEPLKAESFF